MSVSLDESFKSAQQYFNELKQDPDDTSSKQQIENIKKELVSTLDRNKKILKDENEKRVRIQLLVENDSRVQNGIYETAVIGLYNDKDKEASTPLILTLECEKDGQKCTDTSIDEKNFRRFEFTSLKMSNLSKKESDIVKDAFVQQYAYFLSIKDINDKIWYEPRKIRNLNINQNEEHLKRKTLDMITKRSNFD